MREGKAMDRYLKAFESVKANANSEPSWLQRLREAAMSAFAEKGFPTAKDGAWRYTDLAVIRNASFILDREPSAGTPDRIEAMKKEYQGDRILFRNGRYAAEASSLPENVEVLDLQKALAAMPELEKHFGTCATPEKNTFAALNTALFDGGVLIRIPDGQALKAPLRLIFIAEPEKEGTVFHPRILILAGTKSRATLVENYVSANGKNYFTNSVSEVFLKEGASLEHAKIQNEAPNAFHVAATWVDQQKGSSFSSVAVSAGARFMRNDCHVDLAGEESACALNGLYLAGEDQLLDHHTFIDHQKPAGKSRQFFKGVLAGRSRGVFGGRVLVRKGAQKTDATQANKNLLLSDQAKVDTQPELEILADDVKCSHGAAVGQLQQDAIFYLRARGISERNAGRILAEGFARELIERSGQDFLKDELMILVNEKLEKQFK